MGTDYDDKCCFKKMIKNTILIHDWCFKDLTATEYSGLVNLQMLLQLSLSELDKLQEETFRSLNNVSSGNNR